MRNPNAKILLIVLLLIAATAAVGLYAMQNGKSPQERDSLHQPEAAENTAEAKAYLRVQVGGRVFDPVPLADGEEWTITQEDGKTNVVRATDTGVVMHASTCENQSCVLQGEVSLENRDSRVLMNMIICLPNQVILEVLTPEEAGMEAPQ